VRNTITGDTRKTGKRIGNVLGGVAGASLGAMSGNPIIGALATELGEQLGGNAVGAGMGAIKHIAGNGDYGISVEGGLVGNGDSTVNGLVQIKSNGYVNGSGANHPRSVRERYSKSDNGNIVHDDYVSVAIPVLVPTTDPGEFSVIQIPLDLENQQLFPRACQEAKNHNQARITAMVAEYLPIIGSFAEQPERGQVGFSFILDPEKPSPTTAREFMLQGFPSYGMPTQRMCCGKECDPTLVGGPSFARYIRNGAEEPSYIDGIHQDTHTSEEDCDFGLFRYFVQGGYATSSGSDEPIYAAGTQLGWLKFYTHVEWSSRNADTSLSGGLIQTSKNCQGGLLDRTSMQSGRYINNVGEAVPACVLSNKSFAGDINNMTSWGSFRNAKVQHFLAIADGSGLADTNGNVSEQMYITMVEFPTNSLTDGQIFHAMEAYVMAADCCGADSTYACGIYTNETQYDGDNIADRYCPFASTCAGTFNGIVGVDLVGNTGINLSSTVLANDYTPAGTMVGLGNTMSSISDDTPVSQHAYLIGGDAPQSGAQSAVCTVSQNGYFMYDAQAANFETANNAGDLWGGYYNAVDGGIPERPDTNPGFWFSHQLTQTTLYNVTDDEVPAGVGTLNRTLVLNAMQGIQANSRRETFSSQALNAASGDVTGQLGIHGGFKMNAPHGKTMRAHGNNTVKAALRADSMGLLDPRRFPMKKQGRKCKTWAKPPAPTKGSTARAQAAAIACGKFDPPPHFCLGDTTAKKKVQGVSTSEKMDAFYQQEDDDFRGMQKKFSEIAEAEHVLEYMQGLTSRDTDGRIPASSRTSIRGRATTVPPVRSKAQSPTRFSRSAAVADATARSIASNKKETEERRKADTRRDAIRKAAILKAARAAVDGDEEAEKPEPAQKKGWFGRSSEPPALPEPLDENTDETTAEGYLLTESMTLEVAEAVAALATATPPGQDVQSSP